MKILVINSGSSSVKYQLFDMRRAHALAKGSIDRIGFGRSNVSQQSDGGPRIARKANVPDHERAIGLALELLTDPRSGVIADRAEIGAVGHRVVHGGERFTGSVIITGDVRRAIRANFDIAPLHNPPNLTGITVCKKLLPNVPHVAAFDTAFHQTLPPSAYLYAIPYKFYKKDRIRKYGFHGTSHKYVALRTAEMLKRPIGKLRIITCHLGNGCSITAVDEGRSVETSMGLTPLQGLVMGTRCGDIDPAVIFYLMQKKRLSAEKVNDILNKESGLLGLSGVSNDMRDVYSSMAGGNARARLAFELFTERAAKYIGAYAAAMGGIDALAFTAGIGENHVPTRKAICGRLSFMGIKIDAKRNNSSKKEKVISAPASKVKVLVVPTNEELMIARETAKLVG